MADMASIRFASLSFVLKSILVASMAVFFLKGYQERIRTIRLSRQGFVSASEPSFLGARILNLLAGDATSVVLRCLIAFYAIPEACC